MSKRKLAFLFFLSGGYMTALGCSLFGPLRLSFSSILNTILGALGGG